MSNAPSLPDELTELIMNLTIRDLVDEERHGTHPIHTSLAGPFLTSACLVSRAWCNIAQPQLYETALVKRETIVTFEKALKAKGLVGSVRGVRIGREPKSNGWTRMDFTAIVRLLGEIFSSLEWVEFVGGSPDWGHLSRIIMLPIDRVLLSRQVDHIVYGWHDSGAFDFVSIPSLTFSAASAASADEDESAPLPLHELSVAFRPATSFSLTTATGDTLHTFLALDFLVPGPQNPPRPLLSLRLDSHCPVREWLDIGWGPVPSLTSLSIQYRLLPRFRAHALPPSLTSLEIVPTVDAAERDPDATEVVLKTIRDLTLLGRLEVPEYWRSGVVESVCEERGIALRWTCESGFAEGKWEAGS